MSRDFIPGCLAAAAVRHYYRASATIAKMLAIMFKGAFPGEYARYQTAFEAGVWYDEDPGPWISRAIVYKLHVNLHHDAQDAGPTATFCVGDFEGGYLELPQLKVKLK